MTTRLTVVKSGLPLPAPADGEEVVSDAEFRGWVKDGRLLRRIQRYDEVRLMTDRLDAIGRPLSAWLLRAAARRRTYIVDREGRERAVTLGLLAGWSARAARDATCRGALLKEVASEVASLEREHASRAAPRFDRRGTPLYLRTDLSFDVRAGGSVGHIAGVVNELRAALGNPVLVTTAAVPTIDPAIEVHYLPAPEAFWNFRELPTMVLNGVSHDAAMRALAGRIPSVIYHRYSLNNFAGLRLARELNVPIVLEYNGSEIWMGRHWGRPLKYEALADRIELLNLRGADLVVVVSAAMRDELLGRGVPAGRILVNPNAVDPSRYRPDLDGGAVRREWRLESATVIGFVSTFQAWHGAEVLADAFADLIARRPDLRSRVRLLMIGTGPLLAGTRERLERSRVADCARFTGLVEQGSGPAFLAACDILVSPHVPNPDGTAFFGSPTKLFEYMAMGRGIVASALDQIGEVLRDGETALLVPPADVDRLSQAIERLVDDPALAARLGEAARRDVVAHHTWRIHVQRIVDALASVSAPAA